MSGKGLILSIGVACSVLVLALGCQQAAAPQPTPKEAATPAKQGETPAASKPAAQAAEKPVRGGILRIVTLTEFTSLDANTITAMDGSYSLYENLIEPDKDGNLTKEGLAKDWTISGDGKSITFKLREGVKFHDGTDFDSAAVKFNVDRMKDPASKSPFAEYYVAVASVEAVDKLTVKFNLSQPDVLILPRLAGGAGGLMVSPAAVKKYGQDFPRNPVGTGPFQFVEWKAGDRVTLKRFEGYWKKDRDGNPLPYMDGVVYQFIADPTTSLANLRTGQIDLMVDSSGGAPVFSMEARPLVMKDTNLSYGMRPIALTQAMGMNTKRTPFDNKGLRQAVALALDRQGMADLMGGTAWASIIHPLDKAYDDGKSGMLPARDVAKAKAKMAEAGYPAGGLKVKYLSGAPPEAVKIAEVTKANLAEIGIEMEIEVLGGAALTTRVRTEGSYQIASGATNISVGDPGHYLSNAFLSRGSRNYYGPYGNPRFDEALEKALVTYDQEARAALYNEAVRVLVEDAPFVPLYVMDSFAGMSKKVRNFTQYWDTFKRPREIWLAQ